MCSKKWSQVVGVDIGGSHITSAVVDLNDNRIAEKSLSTSTVNNKGSKESILRTWAAAILKSISAVPKAEITGIGFAMPGPFDYATGRALFERNDKYEELFGVNIPSELSHYLGGLLLEMRFVNDAMAFGVGASRNIPNFQDRKIIALTLGTGFGSTFIANGFPDFRPKNASNGGFLWDIPFKDGIADDFFSTRWFLKSFEFRTGEKSRGVRELIQSGHPSVNAVFKEFSSNLAEFVGPYLQSFEADTLILGGNIAKASNLFIKDFKEHLSSFNSKIHIQIDSGSEASALTGCAQLFDPVFYHSIRTWISEK